MLGASETGHDKDRGILRKQITLGRREIRCRLELLRIWCSNPPLNHSLQDRIVIAFLISDMSLVGASLYRGGFRWLSISTFPTQGAFFPPIYFPGSLLYSLNVGI